jgi:CRP-like cAMP-binding protein
MSDRPAKSVKKPTGSDATQTLVLAAEVLAQAALTEHCHAATREAMLRSGRIERRANRAPLHRFGEPITELCFVLAGALEVSRISALGKRHVVSFLEPGQVFGLVALLDGQGGIHDTVAHGELTVLQIPKAQVMQTLGEDAAFRDAVLRLLCDRSRVIYGVLMDHVLLSLRVRTARTIHNLALTYGIHRGQRIVIALRLSQEELADMLGVTRQSTNRELKQLEAERLIRLGNAEIELLDSDGLRRVAEG